MMTSLTLFLCSSPKTQIKVRLTESWDEHSHLLKPRLWATEMNDVAPDSVTIAVSCDCWCERSCMGVLVTFRFFLSHQALTLVIFLSFVPNVTLPVTFCLAGVWLFVVYLESLLMLEWHSLTLPPVIMQLYKDYRSSLNCLFLFLFLPPFMHLSALPSFSLHLHQLLALNFLHTISVNITYSFACFSQSPSALPCPSLSLSLSLSGTFQVVTRAATVAVQSPASPTWPAPFCWWISSSTSRGGGRGRRGSVQS